MEKDVISSTEGQIPEGQVPELILPDKLSEFPPPQLMVGGREYQLLGGSSLPRDDKSRRFHYFLPDPIQSGFSSAFKTYGEEELRKIIESQKNDKHAF